MNWSSIFGSSQPKDKHTPALNALEQQRLKQVESLRTFHPSITEVKKDIEYRITIFIEEEPLQLHVYLPPNFPNEVPVVTVSPAVTHPWINDQMFVTGCDSLNNFYMHSNLGRALQDVCKEFRQNAPKRHFKIPSQTSSSEFHEPALVDLVTTNQSSSQSNPEGFGKIADLLENYSVEQLRELNNNPEKLMELIFNVDLIHSSEMKRDAQMTKIEEIARENLEQKKPRLEEARERLVAKYEEIAVVRAEFDQWSSKQNDLFEKRTSSQIRTALQVTVAQAEEESENIAEEFLNENFQVDEFIKKFTEKRKLTHIRRWKEENVLKL